MEREIVESKVKQIFKETALKDITDPNESFANLNIDSLDILDTIITAEAEFYIEIPDDEIGSLKTPNNLIDLILSKVRNKH